MKSWNAPEIPSLPGTGKRPVLFDSMSRSAVATPKRSGEANLYVCGITPYDATHLGHAATYVAYDLLGRVWRDAGIEVRYVQNVTDIDDPLLERAEATGADWRELAEDQTELFRTDMEALRVIPPDAYIGAVESIPAIVEAVRELVDAGAAYVLDSGDVYQDLSRRSKPPFGALSGLGRERMLELFAARGGDPEVEGKKDPLDPLLWRAAREGEPHWPGGPLGPGRPGWHIECVVIARDHLGLPITVQAGGEDLIFPHHEMGSQHACALTSGPLAKRFSHAGMVGYEGEKMSKSKGNLVLVSRLRASGVDPRVIRLALLSHHYRCDWEFTEDMLDLAADRLSSWEQAIARGRPGRKVLRGLRATLADDLDAPGALKLLDAWSAAREDDPEAQDAAEDIALAVDALLGVRLERRSA